MPPPQTARMPQLAAAPQPLRVSSGEIWRLTWPQTITMLTQFMVGFVDVQVAGYIHSDVQAALGIITQCLFFLLVVGMAASGGAVAAMTQAMGANLPKRADRYAGLIVRLGGLLCLAIFIPAYCFSSGLLQLLRVPPSIFDLTRDLWDLYLLMLPANYLTIVGIAIFRAYKNVMIPLFSGILVCIVNTFFDYGLGLGMFGLPNLGAKGLIWASILSVAAGGVFNLIILIKQGFLSRTSFAPRRWEKKALPYIIKVALPAGGMSVLWQIGYLMLYSITATLPMGQVAAVAGLTAGMRIEAALFMPALAFNLTGSVLVGNCLGAGNKAEAKRVALRVIGAGALSMSVIGVLIFPFIDEIVSLIAKDPAVHAVAVSYMHWNIPAIPFTVTSMVMGGIMTGAGSTIYTLVIYSAATWLVRLPLAWYMGHHIWKSAAGVFAAMLISQAVQAASAMYVLLRLDWYRFASTAKRLKRKTP